MLDDEPGVPEGAPRNRAAGTVSASSQGAGRGTHPSPAPNLATGIVDDHRAAYIIVHSDADRHQIEHRRVAYDREAFLERLAESGHPQQDYIASFQRGDQIRYPAEREGAPTLTM